MRLDFDQEPLLTVSGQSQVEKELWEIQISPECGQLRVGRVAGFHVQTVLVQELDHIVRHGTERYPAHILAVKIKVFRKPVDSLDEPQIGSADKGQPDRIGRIRQMIQNQQLKILLEHIPMKTAVTGNSLREETAYESKVNHRA